MDDDFIRTEVQENLPIRADGGFLFVECTGGYAPKPYRRKRTEQVPAGTRYSLDHVAW